MSLFQRRSFADIVSPPEAGAAQARWRDMLAAGGMERDEIEVFVASLRFSRLYLATQNPREAVTFGIEQEAAEAFAEFVDRWNEAQQRPDRRL